MSNQQEATENDELVLFRCTECGKTSVSIGWLHAHIERHVGLGPFGIIPIPWKTGRPSVLNQYTEALRVDEYSAVDVEDVEIEQ